MAMSGQLFYIITICYNLGMNQDFTPKEYSAKIKNVLSHIRLSFMENLKKEVEDEVTEFTKDKNGV